MTTLNMATFFAVSIVVVVAQCGTTGTKPEANPGLSSIPVTACGSEIDLSRSIRVLSSDQWTEVDKIRDGLLDHASQSNECRTEIISALMGSMNKPNLDFVGDRPSYFLWLNGSILLGRLKAIEALDLLIDHLDLNDGEFSASMTHQPAVVGIRAMGSAALPKLARTLKNNQNRNIRLAAAFCLSEIRGASVMPTIKDALKSESDSCVRHFLEISVELSKMEEVPGSSRSTEQEAAATELRRRLLAAMRCVN